MNRRVIISIVLVVGVIIIISVAYFLFIDLKTTELLDTTNNSWTGEGVGEFDNKLGVEDKEVKNIVPVINNAIKVRDLDPVDMDKDDLRRMASSFAERFGSFSNQSNFSNVVDLKIFMTKNMREWSEGYVEDQRKLGSGDNAIYYGITTISVASRVVNYDTDFGKSDILVSTRRREATMTTNNISNTSNQDILVTFIKENGAWKVDKAYWQDI